MRSFKSRSDLASQVESRVVAKTLGKLCPGDAFKHPHASGIYLYLEYLGNRLVEVVELHGGQIDKWTVDTTVIPLPNAAIIEDITK